MATADEISCMLLEIIQTLYNCVNSPNNIFSLSLLSLFLCVCSDHMANVCINSPQLIPKFVYSTKSYLGEFQNDKTKTTTKSYECCDCVGDCTLNPDCACIMR